MPVGDHSSIARAEVLRGTGCQSVEEAVRLGGIRFEDWTAALERARKATTGRPGPESRRRGPAHYQTRVLHALATEDLTATELIGNSPDMKAATGALLASGHVEKERVGRHVVYRLTRSGRALVVPEDGSAS